MSPERRNFMPPPGSRIAVAMSGGVDSSVAAYLLAKAGYDIIGLTAWTLNGPGKCCNDALVNAGRVCEILGVPYDTVDLRAEFAHYVMDYYNNSYEAGLTPNPCVECNRYVKWEQLVRYAVDELGVDYVATGHYAILEHVNPSDEKGLPENERISPLVQQDSPGSSRIFPSRLPDSSTSLVDPAYGLARNRVRLYRSVDEHKDQTYMMTGVYPKDLERTVFPLGEMTKPEVVALAREVDLPTAYSKESQDICFVLNGQAKYMDMVFGQRKGDFVDFDTGKKLGEHDGYYRFTLGQRKGVGVAAGRPVYVVKIDPDANIVYLGDAHHLESTTFTVLRTNWLEPAMAHPDAFPRECMVKIRYNTPPSLGLLEYIDEHTLKVTMRQPASAITPGQIAAFYDPDFRQLYGGGYIEKHLVQHLPSEADWQHKRDHLPDLYCQV